MDPITLPWNGQGDFDKFRQGVILKSVNGRLFHELDVEDGILHEEKDQINRFHQKYQSSHSALISSLLFFMSLRMAVFKALRKDVRCS